MRRKDETELLKKRLSQKEEEIEYSIDTEISILLPYIKIMPISMRLKFLGPLKNIATKENLSLLNIGTIEQLLLSRSSSETAPQGGSSAFLNIFCHLLKLPKLR
jgi:hypothetical protein